MIAIKNVMKLALLAWLCMAVVAQAQVPVTASVETAPVPHSGDAADDATIWIHPTDKNLSLIVGTDKQGGIALYELNGQQRAYQAVGDLNNIDLRYGFSLGGSSVAIISASNRSNNSISVFSIDPATRQLRSIAARTISTGLDVYGYCMYRSAETGKYYGFVNSKSGAVEQYEFFEVAGKVDARLVRSLKLSGQVEGCTADDELGHFYIGQETSGIYKYGAEPGDGQARVTVDTVSGNIRADVEGLTLAYGANGSGYLIASSQGNNRFVVYERANNNSFVGSFNVVDGAIDGVSDTDGVRVVAFPLNSSFPGGVFISQDGSNPGGNQNFKLTSWASIVSALNLRADYSQDPRVLSGAMTPQPTPEPTPVPTPTPTPNPTPNPMPTPAGSFKFKAIADAGVYSANATTNFGGQASISVDAKPRGDAYLKFRVSGVTGAIQSAKLRLYVNNRTSNGPELYSSAGGWTEAAISFQNKPATAGAKIADLKSVPVGYVEVDVKNVVTKDGEYSFALIADSSDGLDFDTRESSRGPELLLTASSIASSPQPTPAPAPTPNPQPTPAPSGANPWIMNAFVGARSLTGNFTARTAVELPAIVMNATGCCGKYAFAVVDGQAPVDSRVAFVNVSIKAQSSTDAYGGAIGTSRSYPGTKLFLSNVSVEPNWPVWRDYSSTNYDGLVLDGSAEVYAEDLKIKNWNADSAIDIKADIAQFVRLTTEGKGHRTLRFWRSGPHYIVDSSINNTGEVGEGSLLWFADCAGARVYVYNSKFNGSSTVPANKIKCDSGTAPQIEYLTVDPRTKGEMHPMFNGR